MQSKFDQNKKFEILTLCPGYDGMVKKTISRYTVPLSWTRKEDRVQIMMYRICVKRQNPLCCRKVVFLLVSLGPLTTIYGAETSLSKLKG
jgi:hypothetical protein